MTFEEFMLNTITERYVHETSEYDRLLAAYSAGVQAERERCVRIAEKTFKSTEAKYGMTWYLYHEDIAAAIRGQKNG